MKYKLKFTLCKVLPPILCRHREGIFAWEENKNTSVVLPRCKVYEQECQFQFTKTFKEEKL